MPRPASTPLPSEELSDALRRTVTPRGPNWSDEDSLKLVEAYKNVMAEKDGLFYALYHDLHLFRNRNTNPFKQKDMGKVLGGCTDIFSEVGEVCHSTLDANGRIISIHLRLCFHVYQ